MKTLLLIILLIIGLIVSASGETNVVSNATNITVVFREPFTLKLHIDKEHYYEQKFPKIPYVADNNIYLFKGDEFGITLNIQDGAIQSIGYQPDLKKADVVLKFTEEINSDGDARMTLVIHNHSNQKLLMDALMTVPGKDAASKTGILPIGAGLSNYESWPHPIVQLVLQNIRLKEKPGY